MTTVDLAILAACTQVLVLATAAIRTVRGRFRDVYSNGVRPREIAVRTEAYTEPVQKLQANLTNQFETPVYFFAATLFGLQTGAVSGLFAALAWVYVLSRIIHHVIHTGWNHLLYRMSVFMAGGVAVIAMWLLVAIEILTG
ncbi:MAG: MAPEG family protein [Pseudomonadota bacterium]